MHVDKGTFKGIIDRFIGRISDAFALDVLAAFGEVVEPELVASRELLEGALIDQFAHSH